MKFRTEYPAAPEAIPLDPERSLVLLGSCFTDNIGQRFADSGWDVAINPCGTLFNPSSIAASIRMALNGTDPEPVCLDGRWTTWDFPTRWSAADPVNCLELCRDSRDTLLRYLTSAQALFVTFGTAWVYELADEPGRVVANCQKQPERLFRRRRLTPEEIAAEWIILLKKLQTLNPGLKVIFTVSPVRHLRDGFAGNSLSKATLRLAIEKIMEGEPNCRKSSDAGSRIGKMSVHYFPAYEIVTDDLRDYRFYGADLVHPSDQAVEYIWEKLCDTCLDASSRALVAKREADLRSSRHRPIIK